MTSRRVLPLIALLLAAILMPADVTAREEKRPSEVFAEKEKKFGAAVGSRYVGLAKWDLKNLLFQFAIMDFETALEYDPRCKDARKYLGHTRRKGEWVVDPAKAPKEKQNKKPQNWTDTDMKKLLKERDELVEGVKGYAADKYAGLGMWCRKKGLDLQAKKAFELALKNDKDCEKARKAMGHVCIDGEWLTPKQAQARKEAKEGRFVEDGSQWESALGLRLKKAESGHFRIETVLTGAELKRYIKECETTYAYFLRDFGRSPTKEVWPGRKARFLVLATTPQWHKYVDVFGTSDKEFTKTMKGSTNRPGISGAQYQGAEGSVEGTVDMLVHRTAHFLVFHELGLQQCWIQEGFAYYYTLKVLNSTNTHCVARDPYSNVRNDKGWGDSNNWKDLIKAAVRDGEDFDLRQLLGLKITGMKQPQAVKAWSVITWFFDHQKEAFMKWLDLVAGSMNQEKAFKECFGKSLEELDKEWREYVLENY
jgi:tetratricopeptide (TPR) repeat protein